MPRTSPGWLTLLLGCLLLLTGCAIDPEHFDGLNPVPGAARKDVAYSEMRALRAVATARADASAQDAFSWQPCSPPGSASGLQCGRLTVAGGTDGEPAVTLDLVRRPALDPSAGQGVAVLPAGPGVAAQPLLAALADDPSYRQLNRTLDLMAVAARSVGDLDAVRSALGEQTWSLIGSGPAAAEMVADYVRAHPEHTRAAVLVGPDGTVQGVPVAASDPTRIPEETRIRVAVPTCPAGTAGSGGSVSGFGLMAAASDCPAPPVLVLAGTADAEGGRAAADAWSGILLTVADGAGRSTDEPDDGACVDAVIESFVVNLVLPADGPCA